MENDIKRHEGDNLGGVVSFRFIPVKGLVEYPEPFNSAIHHELELNPDYRWFEGYGTEYTMQYKEDVVKSEHGSSYKRSFTAKVPKDRPYLVNLFNAMKDNRYVLDIAFSNGKRRLCGTIEEPLSFNFQSDSKAEVSARNEYNISFEGEGASPSPFYLV